MSEKTDNSDIIDDFDEQDDEYVELETIILFDDETGDEIECAIIDSTTYNDERYLLVVESNLLDEDEPDAIILKETSAEDGSGFIYSFIDDDTEFENISNAFKNEGIDYELN